MNQLTHLRTAYDQAKAEVSRLKLERDAMICDANTHKPGMEFSTSNERFRVRSVAVTSDGSGVWLTCNWWTSSKRWSQGTKAVYHKVEA